MEDKNNKALDALRKGKRKGRDKVKEDVSKDIDLPTKRERLVAANATGLVPTLALSNEERQLYDTIALHLEKSGMLATVDTIPLTMLAQSMFLYGQAKRSIEGLHDAITTVGTNGSPTVTGEYMVMKTERKAVMDLMKDLGLDPKARLKMWSAIANLTADSGDDGMDDIFK